VPFFGIIGSNTFKLIVAKACEKTVRGFGGREMEERGLKDVALSIIPYVQTQ
jgi:hypothetical protein